MFFEKGSLEDRGNIFFTSNCMVASRESCGPAEKMTPSEVRIELNVKPLKWYKASGINGRNEELFNIRKFRNRTV